jgi:hypothetical protein
VVTSFTLKPIKIHYLNFLQISLKSLSLLIAGVYSLQHLPSKLMLAQQGVTTLYGNVQTGILRSGLNVINPLLMWLTSIFELKLPMSSQMKEISFQDDDSSIVK